MTTLVLAAFVWAVACGAVSLAIVTGEPNQGPILLELNPPLLAQPIFDDLPEAASAPAEEEEPEAGEPDEEPEPDETTAAEETPTDQKADKAEEEVEQDEATETAGEVEEQSETDQADPNAAVKPADPPPLPELTEQMKTLRHAMRQTIASYFAEPFNTRDNTPTNVLQVCMAFGCDAEVRRGSPAGQKLNAFTCLCWNHPCAGRELLRICDGEVTAGIGYGLQEYPGQFLAILGLSRVPIEYPLNVGNGEHTVGDLVEYEKKSCRSGEKTSLKLIGLARYLPTDAEWKNDLGESWSISRLIKEELARAADSAPAGGTYRLLALSYAVDRRVKHKQPIDGQFKRAQAYVADVAKYALELQNPDGSWHPGYFAFRGSAGSTVDQLRSTGQILRWLAIGLPEEQLRNPQIVRGVTFLTNSLGSRRYRNYLPSTSNQEIAARLGAVHALVIYDQRLFGPYDAAERRKAEQEKAEVERQKAQKQSVAMKTAQPS
ncbi:MAG: hypothetical protein JW888_14490 [Pirellulales bacterium]|nr:hypothetical protein [Pirellulales bacterium]